VSINQFLRIFWAHRWLTVITALSCVAGAFLVIMLVPPKYVAHSRVLLNLLKPDPVTGEYVANNAARSYIATQVGLIRDDAVAGQAVENLGWMNDPFFIEQYQARPKGDKRDFRRFLAAQIIEKIDADVVAGSNILEIKFSAPSPVLAANMADALRAAYIDNDLAVRRREANRNADWYTAQAKSAQNLLDQAESAKTAFEKQTGLVMQPDNVDTETARLRTLAGQAAGYSPVIAPPIMGASGAAMQLAAIDAQIAQAAKNLGPNHPMMVEMKARRAVAAQMAAQEANAARAAAGASASAAAAGSSAITRAIAAQTSRVIAKRGELERLTQSEVNLRRDQVNKAMMRAAELRQEAAVSDTGITPLGSAAQPSSPDFPKKGLMLGGALGLGLAFGAMLSILLELLDHRVRSYEDLEGAFEVPVLAVIGQTHGGANASIIDVATDQWRALFRKAAA
jgi:succinoglycan biosynthesis transport protein ExoP